MTNNNQKSITVKVSEILPNNCKLYSHSNIEELVENISNNGLLEPLVLDTNYKIISGSRRYLAIKNLGWKTVNVLVTEPVDDKDLEYRVFSHNRTRQKTFSEVLNEIDMLKKRYNVGSGNHQDKSKYSWRDIAAKELGFSSTKLHMYIVVGQDPYYVKHIDNGDLSLNQAYTQIERQKTIEKNIAKKNLEPIDYITDPIKIYTRDSSDLNPIPTGSVQCIFTSPPYGNSLRDYGINGLGREESINEYVKNLVKHFKDSIRVLNDKGSFFLNIADCYVDHSLQMIPQRVVSGLMLEYGLMCRNTIIWKKKNFKPSKAKNMCHPSYEYIFHLVKSKDYYYDPTYVPTQDSSRKKKPSVPFHRTKPNEKSISPIIGTERKNISDYWTEDTVTTAVANHSYMKKLGIMHPAPFPNEIAILPILQTTKPGDIVMDPFMGSGTVLRVAESLKRRAIGIDLQSNFTTPVITDFQNRIKEKSSNSEMRIAA